VVSFKNALIVLTSNIGARLIQGVRSGSLSARVRAVEAARDAMPAVDASDEPDPGPRRWTREPPGPSSLPGSTAEDGAEYTKYRVEDVVRGEVRQYFRPEFLNRLDEQIVFHKLGRAEVRTIAGLMIQEIMTRVRAHGYVLQLSTRLVDHIIAEGYSDEYGVRPLRNTFVRYVEDSLSEYLLKTPMQHGCSIGVDILPNGDIMVVHRLVPGALVDREEAVTVDEHSANA